MLLLLCCIHCQSWGRFWEIPSEIPSNPFYGFYGAAGSEQFNGIAASSDKGLVAIGSTSGNILFSGSAPAPVGSGYSNNAVDAFVIKLNGVGEVEWQNYFGGSANDTGNGVAATADGGFALLITSNADIPTLHGKTPINNFSAAGNDMMIAKISSTGALQWYTFLGGGGNKTGVSISAAKDGSIYALGNGSGFTTLGGISALNTATGTGDMLVLKFSANGAMVWWLYIGGSSGDTATAIAATDDGGVVAAGHMANTPQTNIIGGSAVNTAAGGGANQDAIVARFDAAGTGLWHIYVGSTATSDTVSGVKITPDGGVIVSGTAGNALAGTPAPPAAVLAYSAGNDAYALKLSSSGSPQWLTYLGGPSGETGGPVAATADGGAVVMAAPSTNIASIGGLTPLNNYNASSDWLQFKLSSAGNLEWFQFLGSPAGDSALSITETSDRHIAAVGFFGMNQATLKGITPKNNYAGAGTDAVVVKLNANGGT